jgi:outer membrane protein assembly factor BamB
MTAASRLLIAPVLAVVTVAACSTTAAGQPGATTSPSGQAAPSAITGTRPVGPGTNWPAYHGNPQRTGVVRGLPAAGPLSLAWQRPLDGEVAGQPLVIGGTVVAATEADTVYGLSRATGKIQWHTQVGQPVPLSDQPCGNLNPLGITSTPVYDPANHLVYVVAQDGPARHLLAGLRPSDGHRVVTRVIPPPDHAPAYDQQRSALALDDGYVDVAFGGHFGDCGPYIGSIVAVPATGRGQILSYLVPAPSRGGIWTAAGPVVAPDGTIYVSVGNGIRTGPPYDGSQSVLALTPRLRRIGLFAPANWAALSAADQDLGASSPALLSNGRLLQVGKDGTGYLLNATHLGGIGGQLAQQQVCPAFGGAAVAGTVAYVPCFASALTAVNTAGDRISILWRSPGSVWGSPVVGGGAIFVAQPKAGVLYELDPRTGTVRQHLAVAGQLPDFASPSLSGILVLIGTLSGVVAVRGA